MRILPGLDAQRESPRAEDEAEHRGIFIPYAAHRQRTAYQPVAGGIGFYRALERPVGGCADVDIERIGLALGQYRDGGPAVGENRLPHGKDIAHGAVTAVNDEKIDPVAREPGQGMRDLVAGARLFDRDAVGAGAGEILPLVAVATRIVNDPDPRLGRTAGTIDRPAHRRRDHALPVRQAIEIVYHPVHEPCTLFAPAAAYLGLFRQIVIVSHGILRQARADVRP